MMRQYWTDLSARERGLILTASALIAVLIFSLMVIRPLAAFRHDAHVDFEQAAETFVLVNRAAAKPAAAAGADASALRSVITRTAGRAGIVINRINSTDAAIDLSISDTPTPRLLAWIIELERDHRVYVDEATVRPNTDGQTVTARLTVVQGS